MKVLGIVSEYNPLHTGHAYHIKASVEKTGATHVICVMSGHFAQRGEPAIVDKWARAKMALLSGADLVLELPVAFSCASAELFAYGAVRALHYTGVVDYLSFGSEQGELGSLWRIASVLYEEPAAYRELLKKHLSEGNSFAAAREKALTGYLRGLPDNIMSQSNNILAIEYLKALKSLRSNIQPTTIKRQGSSYMETEIAASFSSATAIRAFLQNNGSPEHPLLFANLPETSLQLLRQCLENGRGPVFPEAFAQTILHKIRMMDPQSLKQVPDVKEGLENRLAACAMRAGTLDQLVNMVTTVRYPSARIKRICANLLWGISKSSLQSFLDDETCGYLRVLGFNCKGRELLQRISREGSLPLVTKASNYKSQLSGLSREMFEYDIKATDIYVLGFPNPAERYGGQDFSTPIVRIES
jgi:predicted nucleotidyltransferase